MPLKHIRIFFSMKSMHWKEFSSSIKGNDRRKKIQYFYRLANTKRVFMRLAKIKPRSLKPAQIQRLTLGICCSDGRNLINTVMFFHEFLWPWVTHVQETNKLYQWKRFVTYDMILIIGPLVKAHTFWLMEFIIISSLVLLIISLQH